MTTRKFYKRTLTVEFLSEEAIPAGMSLAQIIDEAEGGEYSMREFGEKEVELNGKQAARALQKQGSDPAFFQLTPDGDDEI